MDFYSSQVVTATLTRNPWKNRFSVTYEGGRGVPSTVLLIEETWNKFITRRIFQSKWEGSA